MNLACVSLVVFWGCPGPFGFSRPFGNSFGRQVPPATLNQAGPGKRQASFDFESWYAKVTSLYTSTQTLHHSGSKALRDKPLTMQLQNQGCSREREHDDPALKGTFSCFGNTFDTKGPQAELVPQLHAQGLANRNDMVSKRRRGSRARARHGRFQLCLASPPQAFPNCRHHFLMCEPLSTRFFSSTGKALQSPVNHGQDPPPPLKKHDQGINNLPASFTLNSACQNSLAFTGGSVS